MTADLTPNGKGPHFRLSLALVSCVLGASEGAQSPGSTISGTIVSKTGSRIPNAHVSVKNVANGQTKTVVGNQEGSFMIHDFPPQVTKSRFPLQDLRNGKRELRSVMARMKW